MHNLQDLAFNVSHQRFTLCGKQILDGTLVDLFLEGVAYHTVKLVRTGFFIQPDVANVVGRLRDAPAHVPINDNTLLFGSQHWLRVHAVKRQQALVDVGNVLKRRR